MAINSIGGVSDNILEGPFGSDKSIQYNNNGVWAGSTNLVWDSNNTRLGVGITTPLVTLDVSGVIQANSSIKTVVGSGVQAELILEQDTVATWEIYNPASSTDLLLKNTSDLFTFTSSGRLGIGVTNPNRPLHVQGNVSAGNVTVDLENTNTGGSASVSIIAGNASGVIGMNGDTLTSVVGDTGNMVLGNYYTAGGSDTGGIAFVSGGNFERMRLDKQGNLAIGFTPSSWSQGNAFEIGGAGNALWYSGTTGDVLLRSNVYYNSGDKYGADGFATQLKVNNSGGFEFFTAPSGLADAAVTLTNRMTIANGGNVGINQNNPVAKLHIEGDNYSISSGGRATDGLIFRGGTDGDGTYTNGLSFSYGAGSSAIAGVQNGIDNDSMGMAFFTHPSGTGTDDAQESMRIQASGDVFLRTGSLYLDGSENLYLGDTSLNGSSAINFQSTNSNTNWQIRQNNIVSSDLTITPSTAAGGTTFTTPTMSFVGSNVGIGATNPSYPLQVNGTIRATDGSDIVSLEVGTQASLFMRDAANYDGIIWPDVNGLNFRAADAASSPAMTIDSSGKVGIGATNPANELTIFGGVGIQPSADPFGTQNSLWICQGGTNNAGISLTIDNNGGTEATTFLQMNASNNSGILGTHGDNDLILRTNNTNRILIEKTTGNVGIGTSTNLQGKLDVDGDLRVTANIVSNTAHEMISLGTDRSIDDYGGLYKDYWRINVVTPGATTTGESAQHQWGDLRFSGVTGSNVTYEDRLTIRYNGNVGIGTTTPVSLSNQTSLTIDGTQVGRVDLKASGGGGGAMFGTSSALTVQANSGVAVNLDSAAGQPITFQVGSSEKARILDSGGITFNGDTAVANALDDYEEGTWVPTFTPSGSGSITLDSGGGAYYTKVGQLVTVTLSINVLSVSAPTGYVDISLPIAPNTSNNKGRSAVAVYVDALLAGNNTRDAIALVEDTSSNIRVYQGDSNTNQADFAQAVTAGTYFNLTASYIAN